MPPVRSQVPTPDTEQIVGVFVVTSSKWPSDNKPEFWPLANNVEARNRPLLFAFNITDEAESSAPDREVESA